MLVLTAVLFSLTALGQRLESRSEDLRLAVRGRRASHARIVIAEIRQSTLDTWPTVPIGLWGDQFARMVRNAHRAGASAVGLDIIFGLPADRYRQEVLDQVIRAGGLSPAEAAALTERVNSTPEFWPQLQLARELQRHPRFTALSEVRGPRSLIDPQLWTGVPDLSVGLVDLPPQRDGVIRQMPLFDHDGADTQPGLAALLAARAAGKDPYNTRDLLQLARHPAGPPAQRSLRINYVQPRVRQAFPSIAAEDLAGDRLTPAERRLFQGAVVLIGPAFSAFNDNHLGPDGRLTPGVYFHAHALSTLLDGAALDRWPPWLEALVALGAGVLTVALTVWQGRRNGLVILIAALGLWLGLCFWAFRGNFLLPLVGPLCAITLGGGGVLLTGAVEQNFQRLRTLFKLYMSPGIAEALLRLSQPEKLAWQEGEATVLFLDIRGSTRLGEGLAPGVLMRELNEFFQDLAPLVADHGGLIYNYAGDGFMAVFGAPDPVPDHPQRAVDAALAMGAALAALNQRRRREGRFTWRAGCGIHTGALVYGTMGAESRPTFSVIGDTANVASRLQSLTKRLESDLVISQATVDQLTRPAELAGPLCVPVDGRTAPVTVYYRTGPQDDTMELECCAPQPGPRLAPMQEVCK